MEIGSSWQNIERFNSISGIPLSQASRFCVHPDSIDTSTAQGRFYLNLFASLAEFERDTIRERTKTGLAAARARGRLGGRSKGLSPEARQKAETAVMLYQQKKSADEIATIIGVGRATVYRYLEAMGQERKL